jgi:hypothetical protein
MSEPDLLMECRAALGFTTAGLANFTAYRDDRMVRRWEKGDKDIPTLLWLVLFYLLRDNGKRELMNKVHHIIQARRPG